MSGKLHVQNTYPNLQYQNDLNGNMTTDSVYSNFSISYDHRNLITELYHIDTLTSIRQYSYATRYWYDETGSRVRKLTYRNAQIPPPQINDWNNPGNGWTLLNNEHYVRGVDGKELATYTSNNLTEWYVWASDMVGKIRGNAKYFFFKDHLGSVRAVVDNNFNLISAVDYDMWGDKMQGRIYNGDSAKFGFTGKEQDDENLYDYFGARYYDSRIGRWGQVEPLLEKYYSFSPYQYSTLNPLKYIDVDGKDGRVSIDGNKILLEVDMNFSVYGNDNQQGLTEQQMSVVGDFQMNIENYYSGSFEINGETYEVTTKFNMILEEDYASAVYKSRKNSGSNVIENAGINNGIMKNSDLGVGVNSGFVLMLASGSELKPDYDTGAHELTHLLGLKGDNKSSSEIEDYQRPRNRPTGNTFERIFKSARIDLSKTSEQFIKGYAD